MRTACWCGWPRSCRRRSRSASSPSAASAIMPQVKVRIIAERGFGDHKLYRLLSEQLHFDYVIRFRANITLTAADGETRTAAAWVRPGGRASIPRGATVTAEHHAVGTLVCVPETDMKQARCLAASRTDVTAQDQTWIHSR